MFNYYIMKNLANSTPSRDTSIFRFELDCTSYTVIKAFSCVALLPVILGIITSNNCEFLAGLDYQYLLVQVPVITGSITTSVFTKYDW